VAPHQLSSEFFPAKYRVFAGIATTFLMATPPRTQDIVICEANLREVWEAFMKALKLSSAILALTLGAAMAFAVSVPTARADERNQMTKLTINEPFQIPGNKVLGPGTYWFQLMDVDAGQPSIVDIYNQGRSQVVATLMTRPSYRMEATGKTELQFATGPQQPATLVRWFYPGMVTGHAFIYSPHTERRLRKENIETLNIATSPSAG
jgi:hypothetical protein